jgi:hypothetical protein
MLGHYPYILLYGSSYPSSCAPKFSMRRYKQVLGLLLLEESASLGWLSITKLLILSSLVFPECLCSRQATPTPNGSHFRIGFRVLGQTLR